MHYFWVLLLLLLLMEGTQGVKASSTSELVNSFTAARLNGFAGGYGTVALAQREMELYALPSAACEALLDLAAANEKRTRRGCS
jgi:hypothetical protein